MNATETFESARSVIELAGLFMVLLPVIAFTGMAVATYYKKK